MKKHDWVFIILISIVMLVGFTFLMIWLISDSKSDAYKKAIENPPTYSEVIADLKEILAVQDYETIEIEHVNQENSSIYYEITIRRYNNSNYSRYSVLYKLKSKDGIIGKYYYWEYVSNRFLYYN